MNAATGTTASPPAASPPVGRPRDPEISHAILTAALELLAQDGYAQLSIAEVAQRAGVHKPAVYRRWPHKLDLAVAAVQHVSTPSRDENTGDVVADLTRLLVDIGTPGIARFDIAFRLGAELALAPELAAAVDERIVGPRRAVARAIVERGIAAGVLRDDLDVELVLDLLFGPVAVRLLNRRAPLRRSDARRVVDTLVQGLSAARAGA